MTVRGRGPRQLRGRLIRPSLFFQGRFPPEKCDLITPLSLERDGFTQLNEEYYRKDFSGVLMLTVMIEEGKGRLYRWDLDIECLLDLNAELAAMKAWMDSKTERFAREWRRGRVKQRSAKRDVSAPGSTPAGLESKWISEGKAMAEQRVACREKYGDFLDLFLSGGYTPQTCTCTCFPLAVCRSTKELKAYFDFARLYMEVFVGLEKSKTSRAIPKQVSESALLTYYAALSVIHALRKRYDETEDCELVENECPPVLRPFVERLTLPGEKSSKKWELRANEIALDLVAPMYGTTPQNLRDLLRKSKPYTIVLQNYVLALDDPKVLLTGNAPLPEVLPLALTNYGRGSLERMIRSFLMRE